MPSSGEERDMLNSICANKNSIAAWASEKRCSINKPRRLLRRPRSYQTSKKRIRALLTSTKKKEGASSRWKSILKGQTGKTGRRV